jgi:hypothetical protein
MKTRRTLLLATTALTPLIMAAGGTAAHAQAVSGPNATIGGFGGAWDNSGVNSGLGAGELRLTMPLSPTWGAQVDGIAGAIGGYNWDQVSGHVFWRDPAIGLFGAYGSWNQLGSSSTFRVGPELELYSSNTTISGVAGWKSGGSNNFFAQLKGSFYVTPNDKLFAGYVYDDGQYATGGFEHQFASTGWSAFGEARVGEGSTAGWLGLRFYFGTPGAPPKTLIQREREDVAPLWLWVASSATPGTTSGAGTTGVGTTPSLGTTSPPFTSPPIPTTPFTPPS